MISCARLIRVDFTAAGSILNWVAEQGGPKVQTGFREELIADPGFAPAGPPASTSATAPAPGSAPAMADLSLRGRAEGTASLEVEGRLNPLAQPLALDLKGRVRDLELPPLSPYSGKYAGYGIERGKLSLEARYQLDGQGVLQARNRIVLDQLTFGERQDGEGVPNWPVKLAVSLLADRNGVVDIQLPIVYRMLSSGGAMIGL